MKKMKKLVNALVLAMKDASVALLPPADLRLRAA